MTNPTLDFRSAEQFYLQALALANVYAPEWADYWPTAVPGAQDVDQDPGLVLLNLFAQLADYTAKIENQMPEQRRLGFFKFMNMQLRPPLPAQAPLHFSLKSGQPPQLLPAQTPVLDAAQQQIRFQTNQDLLVLPAVMSAAMTIIPAQDQFIDAMPVLLGDQASQSGTPIFVADQAIDPAEQALPHWFMMGDPELFKPDDALQSITVTLTGKQLYPEYFDQWFDGALTPLTAQLIESSDNRALDIVLTRTPTAQALTISQVQQELYDQDDPDAGFDAAPDARQDQTPEYWLLVKPGPQVKVLASLAQQLPVITGLSCSFKGHKIQPQQAAYNVVLLDITNSAYPFSETPQKNDAFYLRSDSVFAKTGAIVTLFFALTAVKRTFPAKLNWQFWDGKQWQSFNQTSTDVSTYQFVDTTSNLQYDNPDGATYIQFQCPAMGKNTVAGSEGLWIRSVIAEGGYGQEGGFATTSVNATIDAVPDSILNTEQKQNVSNYLNNVAGVNFSYTFTHTDYYPPYIQSLQITYTYSAKPASFWSYNAFYLSRFLFSPFKPVDEKLTGFYFAFAPEEFGGMSVGNKLALYFYLQQEQAAPGSKLRWEYNDGQQWQALAVDDATYGLSRSGVVGFTIPAAMREAYLFSQTAYWFRVINPHVGRTIRVYGIYPNTVMASNITSVSDEVLGTSNEQQFQTFVLNYKPVLANLALVVIESLGLEAASGADAGASVDLSQISVAADEVARQWQMVDTFAFCGPTDRVYTLDYQNGLITFGDGYNGMIPPAGHNNIIAAYYEYTQGLKGNVDAGAINLLRPGIANITGVGNPAPAAGGVGGDTVVEVGATSPALIRAGGWAVQMQDISALAAAASQQVAQARAVEAADDSAGHKIRIALLALSADPVPYTSPAVLNQVADYVKQYCLAALADRIGTEPPDFVPVAVTAQLMVDVAPDQINALQQAIADRLQAFFQPVFGGLDHRGWIFGQTVQASTVSVFLRQMPEVKAVLGLSLNGRQNGNIVLLPTQLPVAGDMLVYLSLS
ncbi:baseplate J/gp47 family protein [Collimonas silvisoli]|uniref:hypothetical protein n=1 Tax=Collimonas silvisoli TaxID=2825884 RepID=UPI001B8AB4D1|nr:hypothetical protein [Collimonas silvisoli]